MQAQRENSSAAGKISRAVRPEYTAAIRYLDGSCDLFRVRNADSMADARDLVISEVGEVRSLVIALRH
jgi:hypothetical protein